VLFELKILSHPAILGFVNSSLPKWCTFSVPSFGRPDISQSWLSQTCEEGCHETGLISLWPSFSGFLWPIDTLPHYIFNHIIVLEHPVFQLKEFRKQYESYVPMEYKVYLKRMKRFLLNTDLSCSSIHCPGRYSFFNYLLVKCFSADLGNGEIIWLYKRLQRWGRPHYNTGSVQFFLLLYQTPALQLHNFTTCS